MAKPNPGSSRFVVDAVNDSGGSALAVNEDTSLTILASTLLANDKDAKTDDDFLLRISGVTATGDTHGSVVLNPNGTITYTPDANFNGTASFSYTITDDKYGSDTATVTVAVTSANDLPVAGDDAASTNEDTAVTVSVLANDSDLDGGTLAVAGVTTSANTHGSAVVNANGTITYTPDANFSGTATFDYTLSDGQGGTDTATVTVQVAKVVDNFEGNVVTVDYLFPAPTVLISYETAGRIEEPGDGPEIINVTGSRFPDGTSEDFFDLDLDNDHIIFDFIIAGGVFLDGAGLRITDTYGRLDDIIGFKIVSNTLPGFDENDIDFTANSLTLDLSGAGGWDANTVLDIQVLFG